MGEPRSKIEPGKSLLTCGCMVGRPVFDQENEILADRIMGMLETISISTGKCDVGIIVIVAKVAARCLSEMTDESGRKLGPKDRALAEQQFVLLLESELAKHE